MIRFLKVIFCLTLILCFYSISFAKDKIGLYGFYLGQDIESVIKNALDKGYTKIEFTCSDYLSKDITSKLGQYKNKYTQNFVSLDDYQSPYNIKQLNNPIFNNIHKANRMGWNLFSNKNLQKYISKSEYLVIKCPLLDPNKNKPDINLEFIVNNFNNTVSLSIISVNTTKDNLKPEDIDVINNVVNERFPKLAPITDQLDAMNIDNNVIMTWYHDSKPRTLFRVLFYDMDNIEKYNNCYISILDDIEKEESKKATEGI